MPSSGAKPDRRFELLLAGAMLLTLLALGQVVAAGIAVSLFVAGVYAVAAGWLWMAGRIRASYCFATFLAAMGIGSLGLALHFTRIPAVTDAATDPSVYYGSWLRTERSRCTQQLSPRQQVTLEFEPGSGNTLRLDTRNVPAATGKALAERARRDFAASYPGQRIEVKLFAEGKGVP